MNAAWLASFLVLGLALGGPPATPEGPVPPTDAGDESDLASAISFDEALALGGGSRELEAVREALRGWERGGAVSRIGQNPQLQVMPGGRLPGADAPGFELQVTATQGWYLQGYGRANVELAKASEDLLRSEVRARALESRLGAARAWIELRAAELSLAEARREQALARELVALAERAMEAGVGTRLDLANAQAVAAQAHLSMTELEGRAHDLGLHLAREVGEATREPKRTRGDYPRVDLPDTDRLVARLDAIDMLPEIFRHQLERRVALAEAAKARASARTQLSTGVSVQLESNRDLVIFGVLGASVPVFNRGRAQSLQAQRDADLARADTERSRIDAVTRLGIAVHELRHSEERVATLQERVLPALASQVERHEAALAHGASTRIELLRAQHQWRQARRELIAAEALHVWARVELWLYLEALEEAA